VVLVTAVVVGDVVVAADVEAMVVERGDGGGVGGFTGGRGHRRKQTGGDICPQRIRVQIVRRPPSQVQRLQPS